MNADIRQSSFVNRHWKDRLAWWGATVFGIGNFPRWPGTAGSLVGVALFASVGGSITWTLGFAVGACVIGVLSVARAEQVLKKTDASSIVIDEVAGMAFSLAGWPLSWPVVAAAFVLFRIFDIWKPFPIRQIQAWPGAWGVMADDVLAAVCVQACLWGWFYVFGQ